MIRMWTIIQKSEEDVLELSEDIINETEYELTANDEIAQCLKAMINYLPEKYKQAIKLTEFQNLTQRELGERMGLSVSGAKSRVQRARLKLKEMLYPPNRYGNVMGIPRLC